MIEDELVLHEPIRLKRYLVIFCLGITAFAFRRDFNEYYEELSQPR